MKNYGKTSPAYSLRPINRLPIYLTIAIMLSIMLLSACSSQAAPASTPASSTGQLSGRVFWMDDNKPAENISVCLNEPIGQNQKDTNLESYKCKIDTDGKYSIPDIEPGEYMLTIWWIDDKGKPSAARSSFSVKAPGIESNISTTFEGTSKDGGWAWAADFGMMVINAGDVITKDIEFRKGS